MWFENLITPFYTCALRNRRLQQRAMRFVYSSKFTKWVEKNQCKHFRGSWNQARRDLWEYIIKENNLGGCIDYLEFGVHKGESIKWWTEKNKNKKSRFVGFDSFEGLPETWKSDKQKGAFSTHGMIPDIDDKRCSFKVGLFQDTLPEFVHAFNFKNTKVIHLDADLYSSTLFVLSALGLKLKKGDILIFDEFGIPTHEFKAFIEFVHSYRMKYTLLGCANNFTQVGLRID